MNYGKEMYTSEMSGILAKTYNHEIINAICGILPDLNDLKHRASDSEKKKIDNIKAKLELMNLCAGSLARLTLLFSGAITEEPHTSIGRIIDNFRAIVENMIDFDMEIESLADFKVKDALKILLAELIRNAYKHTRKLEKGDQKVIINITLSKAQKHIEIKNIFDPTKSSLPAPKFVASLNERPKLIFDDINTKLGEVDPTDSHTKLGVSICKTIAEKLLNSKLIYTYDKKFIIAQITENIT